MSEPQDPLRSLFQQAAQAGQTRSEAAPVAYIADRARRVRRRRVAGFAAAVCLAFGGGVATAVALLPDRPAPAVPATSPSPSRPEPAPTSQPPGPSFPGRGTTGSTPTASSTGSASASPGGRPTHAPPRSGTSTEPRSTATSP